MSDKCSAVPCQALKATKERSLAGIVLSEWNYCMSQCASLYEKKDSLSAEEYSAYVDQYMTRARLLGAFQAAALVSGELEVVYVPMANNASEPTQQEDQESVASYAQDVLIEVTGVSEDDLKSANYDYSVEIYGRMLRSRIIRQGVGDFEGTCLERDRLVQALGVCGVPTVRIDEIRRGEVEPKDALSGSSE